MLCLPPAALSSPRKCRVFNRSEVAGTCTDATSLRAVVNVKTSRKSPATASFDMETADEREKKIAPLSCSKTSYYFFFLCHLRKLSRAAVIPRPFTFVVCRSVFYSKRKMIVRRSAAAHLSAGLGRIP